MQVQNLPTSESNGGLLSAASFDHHKAVPASQTNGDSGVVLEHSNENEPCSATSDATFFGAASESSNNGFPNRVFIGGLPATATEADLRSYFARFGVIQSVKIIRDSEGVSKGYGFVNFENEDAAKRVRDTSEPIEICGRRVNVGAAVRRNSFNQKYFSVPPGTVVLGTPTGIPMGQAFFPSATPNDPTPIATGARHPVPQAGPTYFAPRSTLPVQPTSPIPFVTVHHPVFIAPFPGHMQTAQMAPPPPQQTPEITVTQTGVDQVDSSVHGYSNGVPSVNGTGTTSGTDSVGSTQAPTPTPVLYYNYSLPQPTQAQIDAAEATRHNLQMQFQQAAAAFAYSSQYMHQPYDASWLWANGQYPPSASVAQTMVSNGQPPVTAPPAPPNTAYYSVQSPYPVTASVPPPPPQQHMGMGDQNQNMHVYNNAGNIWTVPQSGNPQLGSFVPLSSLPSKPLSCCGAEQPRGPVVTQPYIHTSPAPPFYENTMHERTIGRELNGFEDEWPRGARIHTVTGPVTLNAAIPFDSQQQGVSLARMTSTPHRASYDVPIASMDASMIEATTGHLPTNGFYAPAEPPPPTYMSAETAGPLLFPPPTPVIK